MSYASRAEMADQLKALIVQKMKDYESRASKWWVRILHSDFKDLLLLKITTDVMRLESIAPRALQEICRIVDAISAENIQQSYAALNRDDYGAFGERLTEIREAIIGFAKAHPDWFRDEFEPRLFPLAEAAYRQVQATIARRDRATNACAVSAGGVSLS